MQFLSNPTISDLHFLMFVLPGFIVVWSFRRLTKSKRDSGFEYFMLSFVWGFILFLFIVFLENKGFLDKSLLNNPYTIMGFSMLFAPILGWIGSEISKFKRKILGKY